MITTKKTVAAFGTGIALYVLTNQQLEHAFEQGSFPKWITVLYFLGFTVQPTRNEWVVDLFSCLIWGWLLVLVTSVIFDFGVRSKTHMKTKNRLD